MNGKSERVVIIGGGVIGAMCALHIRQSGRDVTIVDRGEFGAGCSHGNCGYVCPSHLLPLAAPGAVRSSLPYLFKRNAPLAIRWRWSPSLWKWMWKFARHCNRKDWLEGAEACHGLLRLSAELFRQMIAEESIDCEWEERGLLFVYHTEKEFEEYAKINDLLVERFDTAAKPYDSQALVELEPALKPGLGGAWHYEGDAHLRPDKLMSELRRVLESKGVELRERFEVEHFEGDGDCVDRLTGPAGTIRAAEIVVAAGAWTPFLNRELGCRIPIQPGKGYTMTMSQPKQMPRIPMILESHRVGVTPMQSGYRIGSTMEFAGYDSKIRPERLELLREGARQYLVEPTAEPVQEEWFGWRPMTWDGKPIIDRSPKYSNVWVAAGHNMLGLSMAPATGKLIAEALAGTKSSLDLQPFSIARFH